MAIDQMSESAECRTRPRQRTGGRPVLMPCRSNTHSANPYKLNPCGARVLNRCKDCAAFGAGAEFR